MNWAWIKSIETSSNFPLILKVLGVITFAGSFLLSWGKIPLVCKVGMIIGLVVFFVGLRYKKITTPVAEAPIAPAPGARQ